MRFRLCGLPLLGRIFTELGDGESKAFCFWAFGKENILVAEFVPLWNKLHGNEFFINEDFTESEIVDKILEMWR